MKLPTPASQKTARTVSGPRTEPRVSPGTPAKSQAWPVMAKPTPPRKA